MDDSENLIRGFIYHGAVMPPFDPHDAPITVTADALACREREAAHVAHEITATYRQLARDRYLLLWGTTVAVVLAGIWRLVFGV